MPPTAFTLGLSGKTAQRRTCAHCAATWSGSQPLAFYTDKASMFETTPKRSSADEEPQRPAATQIRRALTESGTERISAHSPQAKSRNVRFFATAQDPLVKEL